MKLNTQLPAQAQIERAIIEGVALYCDVRHEAMGDKIGCMNMLTLLGRMFEHFQATIIDSRDTPRTPFCLGDYVTSVPVSLRSMEDELEDGLDLHALGTGYESMWQLNSYAAICDVRATMSLRETTKSSGEVVICLLEQTTYNERRNMLPANVSVLVQLLEQQGYRVAVIATSPHDLLPQIRVMSMKECIFQIAQAECVIAGDSGFAHVACALQKPMIGLWPDWHGTDEKGRPLHSRTLDRYIKISHWWELPLYHVPSGIYPNGNPSITRIVEIGTDHRFSPDHVLQCVQELYPL